MSNVVPMAQMDFFQYRKLIEPLAVYPLVGTGASLAIAYCAIGLCEESYELFEKIDKSGIENGDVVFPNEDLDGITYELGDVLWYATRLLCELRRMTGDYDVDWSSIPDAPNTFGMDIIASACVIGGRVKKLVRDTKDEDKHVKAILNNLLVLFSRIDSLARDVCMAGRPEVGLGLSFIATRNIEKLHGRRDRGTIQGEGDAR